MFKLTVINKTEEIITIFARTVICSNTRLTVCKIADELGISKFVSYEILPENFSMSCIAAKYERRPLQYERKRTPVDVNQEFLRLDDKNIIEKYHLKRV